VKTSAAVLLLIIPGLAFAQTEVSGPQSGTWTSAGSPYLVTGEVVVPAGQVLTIDPGVEINFQGHHKFTVNGDLQAMGAENDSIRFTTDTPSTGWGGIRIDSSDISALAYCRIEYGKTAGDYPDMHGGGLALLGSDAVVTNCVFADNDATADDLGMGGAVYATGTGSPAEPLTRFVDCRFIRNHAYGEGGAIKFTGDMNTEITGCEFIENDCNYGGGAISCYIVYDTMVTNCLFTDNYTMFANGGAINTLGSGNTIFLVNCTFTGNTAVTGDGGAVDLAYGTGYFVNTIVFENHGMYSDDVFLNWGGYAEIHHCNLPFPSGATGGDNIDEDPMFVDGFNLDEFSPCVNEGTAYIVLGGQAVDLGPDQYCGPAPDMGAYEYCDATGVDDDPPAVFRMDQNHPNPFNPATRIVFTLPAAGPARVDVLDMKGRLVRAVWSGDLEAGPHGFAWDGRDDAGRAVAAGSYLGRLTTADRSATCKMTLAK